MDNQVIDFDANAKLDHDDGEVQPAPKKNLNSFLDKINKNKQ